MTKTVESYLENLKNPKHLEDINRLRAFLQEELPDAQETMEYSMPTYMQNGHVVASLGSQRQHMSLYLDVETLDQYRDDLGGLNCGKSCVRFKRMDDLPLDTIRAILQETVKKQENL